MRDNSGNDANQSVSQRSASSTVGQDPTWKVSAVVWPTDDDPDPRMLYKDEMQGHRRRFRKALTFAHSSTKAAGIMLLAAAISLAIANSPLHDEFSALWNCQIAAGINDHFTHISLLHVVNDVLMAVFFLLVGLEVKFEIVAGELRDIRQAALPIFAALGGVIAPIAIYSIFNAGNTATSHGWGVPTATDIAFALGILALLGDRIPTGVRVFLSTLAVADDIIAILVIAVFYGQSPSLLWLGLAGCVFLLLLALNRGRVRSLVPYLALGVVLWFCTYMSGVHSTIAGVMLAFAIPSSSSINLRNFISWSHDHVHHARNTYSQDVPLIAQPECVATIGSLGLVAKQAVPPATRLKHKIYPWVYFGILPVFALANAGVPLFGGSIADVVSSPVTIGVFLGLLIGKPLGIMSFGLLTVKLRIASLPKDVSWSHLMGAAILGGVGFTMAIFVANLAFMEETLIAQAKMGVLLASATSGIIGFAYLRFHEKTHS